MSVKLEATLEPDEPKQITVDGILQTEIVIEAIFTTGITVIRMVGLKEDYPNNG
jgi:hypothetical protein